MKPVYSRRVRHRPWRRKALAMAVVAGMACAAVDAPRPLDLPSPGITYTIEARFDPATRAISGREEIAWVNRTPASVAALPMHLYLNGFSHTRTSWMREGDIGRFRVTADDLLRIDPDPWGWIEPLSIRQRAGEREVDLAWRAVQPDDGNPLDRTLVEITLAEAVPPGGTVRLVIEFEGRLPIPIARTGGRRDFFVIAQWHPKIGVVAPAGTVPSRAPAGQFHALTEFSADFADYDVRFTLPEGWAFGGTGRAVGDPSRDGAGLVTHHHRQRAVHDAAFITGSALGDVWRRVVPAGGGPAVDVRWLVPSGTVHQVDRLHEALAGAMDEMGTRVGPYPYDILTVATVPWWARQTGGMEYPTFILGWAGDPLWDRWPMSLSREPEITVIHEFIHQYFYGLVASNEAREALLDEGFTQYWQLEVGRRLWGSDASGGRMLGRAVREEDVLADGVARDAPALREPMRRVPTWLSRDDTWGTQVYDRPALTLETAARLFGRVTLDRVFAAYAARHAFGHPELDDFLREAEQAGGAPLAAFLAEGFERERLPDYRVAGIESDRLEPPVGRVHDGEETEEGAGAEGAEAREEPGGVLVEITDPGWYRGGRGQAGSVRREERAPVERQAGAGVSSGEFFESLARLEGPAWDHLPVEVEFLFEDGVLLRDEWDGRAAWRDYRFVRPARLARVRIDPAQAIRLDVWPQNNGRSLRPDAHFAGRWAAWFLGVAQWAAAGVSMWL